MFDYCLFHGPFVRRRDGPHARQMPREPAFIAHAWQDLPGRPGGICGWSSLPTAQSAEPPRSGGSVIRQDRVVLADWARRLACGAPRTAWRPDLVVPGVLPGGKAATRGLECLPGGRGDGCLLHGTSPSGGAGYEDRWERRCPSAPVPGRPGAAWHQGCRWGPVRAVAAALIPAGVRDRESAGARDPPEPAGHRGRGAARFRSSWRVLASASGHGRRDRVLIR